MKPQKRTSEQVATRYDKNLAHNPEDFAIFQESSTLAMYLSIYLAQQYQHRANWYDPVIRLDMNHFCDAMGYDKASLLQKVENPAHLRFWRPETGERLMERVVEDALYRMTTEIIPFSRQGAHKIDGRYQTISGMQILKKVTVYIDDENRNKFYYDVELGETFRNNLNVFYVTLNLDADAYKRLRKNSATALFLYLLNQQNQLQVEIRKSQTLQTGLPVVLSRVFPLREICRIGEIQSAEGRNMKHRLTRLIELIRETCGVNWLLTWEKGEEETRYAYTPKITFADLLNPVDENRIHRDKQDIFYKEANRELFTIYKNIYLPSNPPQQALDFESWKKDNALNHPQKVEAIQRAQMLIWNNESPVNPAAF